MKKAHLQFTLELPYNRTWYEPLKELCYGNPEKMGAGIYLWRFSINKLDRVIALTNSQIEFSKSQIRTIIKHCNYLREDVLTKSYKGDGKYIVGKIPNGFRLYWYQKKETDNGYTVIEKPFGDVSTEMVTLMFHVLLKYPIGKYTKSKTIAKNICGMLGVSRFNNINGNFEWTKFFGVRKAYRDYFYNPIKILESLGLIYYHKSGKIKREADILAFQTKLDSVHSRDHIPFKGTNRGRPNKI